MSERSTGRKKGSNQGIAKARQEARRERAGIRQAEYDAMTDEQKRAKIEAAPGDSKRQRARLKK